MARLTPSVLEVEGGSGGHRASRIAVRGAETAIGWMKRRIGDRRSKPRFEIVGDLWGSIDLATALLVQNLGRGGALLESPLPLAPESMHWVTALVDGQPHLVQIRVCHSTPAVTPRGPAQYLIGVEFMKLSPGVEEVLVRYLDVAGGGLAEV